MIRVKDDDGIASRVLQDLPDDFLNFRGGELGLAGELPFVALGIVGGRSFLKFYLAALVVAVSVIFLLSETALEKAAFVIKRFAVAIILVTLVFLARNKIASWDFRDPGEPKDVARASAASSSNPDIYHIVLDGYGRHDYLKEFYEYDNGEFIEWLEQKGFYVAHASRSNYPLTRFSLASFLNYEYLDGIPLEKEWTFFNMIQNNKAMRFLRERGYNVVTFETGQTSFDIKRLATHYESMPLVLSEFQNEILNLTLLPTLFKAADFQNTLHRNVILRVFDKLAQPFWEPSPKLVYAHIRTPHPPYVFDAQGNFLSPEKLELLPELTPEELEHRRVLKNAEQICVVEEKRIEQDHERICFLRASESRKQNAVHQHRNHEDETHGNEQLVELNLVRVVREQGQHGVDRQKVDESVF